MAQEVTFWISCQQKTVVLFLTETEYMALSDHGHQLAWAKSLLNEVSFNDPTLYIYGNNLSLLFWGSNLIQEKCSKHIDICYHYIRDLIEDKQIKPYHIDGKENSANILTKNLGQVLFSCFCSSLGLEILWAHLFILLLLNSWSLKWEGVLWSTLLSKHIVLIR